MGSAIACHFANCGTPVLLLDIVPQKLTDKEQHNDLSLNDQSVRNRIVNTALKKTLASKPSPLYHKKFVTRITTGNLEDDIARLADADWIIEVVTEDLAIKKTVFDQIEKHRKPGTLVTSNTSGIPIHLMSNGRSDDFQTHFCGTHFFNPPRYLDLLEIIPGPKTSPEVLGFLQDYGEQFLGKQPVITKDTPAFIGNRVGIYSIMSLFHQVIAQDMTIEEVDALTGPILGRPKSATFRTVDVVGLDTLVHVAKGLYANLPNDEQHDRYKLPGFIEKMITNKWYGSKTGQGFYKKTTRKDGSREIKSLDLNRLEYRERQQPKFSVLEQAKAVPDLADRYNILLADKGKAGSFYRDTFAALFAYVSHRVPEIADALYKIDDAMRAGFGWEHGPFQIWDAIGLQKGLQLAQEKSYEVAEWVTTLATQEDAHFYTVKSHKTFYYDFETEQYAEIPGQEHRIILNNIRHSKAVFTNDNLVVEDLGDGILNVEFRSKANTIGRDVLDGIHQALDLAEKEYRGLVLYNEGKNFSLGANIGMIFMMAAEQDYEELNYAVKYFQDTSMRLRYSSIPVVSAPHGMTLGGGCEFSLHADKVVAAAETYMGLVEFGVGLIPGGGGSKEMTLRAADSFAKGDVEINRLRDYFLTIGMAKVSTSAYEAFDNHLLLPGKDIVVVSKARQLALAKQHALLMAENGYTKPLLRNDIKVLGKQALGPFLVGTDQMAAAHYISAYDQKIADKLAYIMAGGDLSEPNLVSEQYLLDLEREAFLSLCGERQTLERLEHMIKTNKPLRN